MVIDKNFIGKYNIGFEKPVDLSLPLSIQIEITELCNFRCPFCYNDSVIRKREKLPIEKWKKFLYELKELGGVFQCAFSGGEPLLYKDEILELMEILHYDHTGLMLITNGYFLDRIYIEKLCKFNWYWIQVSLDSYKPNIHDELRGMKGSFNKALLAIKCLKDFGLPVAISSVICSKNICDIAGIVKLAYELQVDIVLFSPILPVGRTVFNPQLRLNYGQLIEYEKAIKDVVKEYSSQILIRSALSYEEQVKGNSLMPPFGLLIRPNGDIKIDCLSQEVVGNVFQTSIDVVWRQILNQERWKRK